MSLFSQLQLKHLRRFCRVTSDAAPRQNPMSPQSLERATRIELAFSAWEADVLPLNYARGGVHRIAACTLVQSVSRFFHEDLRVVVRGRAKGLAPYPDLRLRREAILETQFGEVHALNLGRVSCRTCADVGPRGQRSRSW